MFEMRNYSFSCSLVFVVGQIEFLGRACGEIEMETQQRVLLQLAYIKQTFAPKDIKLGKRAGDEGCLIHQFTGSVRCWQASKDGRLIQ